MRKCVYNFLALSMKKFFSIWCNILWDNKTLIIIILVGSILSFCNLRAYIPGTATHALWFDEGMNLMVPANFVLYGEYGLWSETGDFVSFPAEISTGPVVLLPISLSFKLFGIGLWQGRMVMGVYLLLLMISFYTLVKWIYDEFTGILALGFLLTGAIGNPFANQSYPFEPVTHSRYVIGEVPGFFYFTLGACIWFFTLQNRNKGNNRNSIGFIFTGIAFGLAIQAKMIYFLILVAFVLWSLISRQNFSDMLIVLGGAIVPGIIWALYQVSLSKEITFGTINILGWHNYDATAVGTLTSVKDLLLRLRNLIGWGFFVLGIPAMLYEMIYLKSDSSQNYHNPKYVIRGFLIVFTIIWLGWYWISILGRVRHSLAAAFTINIFVASFFVAMSGGLPIAWQTLKQGWNKFSFWFEYSRPICVFFLMCLILLNPAMRLVKNSLVERDDSPYQVAEFLSRSGRPSIIGSERELDFLLGYRLFDLIWRKELKLPTRIDFILCGSQTRNWLEKCPPDNLFQNYQEVFSSGDYKVYKLLK